jgi:hypothetical protein
METTRKSVTTIDGLMFLLFSITKLTSYVTILPPSSSAILLSIMNDVEAPAEPNSVVPAKNN